MQGKDRLSVPSTPPMELPSCAATNHVAVTVSVLRGFSCQLIPGLL